MSSWKKIIEGWYSAVAFAEAGEHETAIEMVNTAPDPSEQMHSLIQALTNSFAAVAFAEVGCQEIAVEIMSSGRRKRHFLEKVGLSGVPVRYGYVPAACDSFIETVGLNNTHYTFFFVCV